jgi:hypothetical protein
VFLQQCVINNVNFPDPKTGNDAVIGNASTVSVRAAGTAINLDFADFVRTEGSVFAFTPSLPTIQALASGTPLEFS